MRSYVDDFELDDWFEGDRSLTWKQARAKNERKKREREKAERERHKARQKELAPLQAHYDSLVQKCMDEGRYFTPISSIWHFYLKDGGEGDIVYPDVEDLPFEDDVPDDDDDYWEHFWNSYEQISQGAKIDYTFQEKVLVDFVEVEIEEVLDTQTENAIDVIDSTPNEMVVPSCKVVEIDNFEFERVSPINLVGKMADNTQVEIVDYSESSKSASTITHMENDHDNSATLIAKQKEIQASHNYFDPFDVYCIPLIFVISDLYDVDIKMVKMMVTALSTSSIDRIVSHYVGLLSFGRPILVFDPGGFEDESFSKSGRMM